MAAMSVNAEQRLAGLTELVATAIANTHAHAELTASRARIVAAGDQARRRIERNLHDGAQQRLVTMAVMLSNIRDTVPAAHVIAARQLACEVQRRGGVTPPSPESRQAGFGAGGSARGGAGRRRPGGAGR
jgi:signal transduction histidine kinase